MLVFCRKSVGNPPEAIVFSLGPLLLLANRPGSPTPLDNWLAPYYQYANRLAMLHFLMKECDPSIPARLLFIYFLGDQHDGVICPQKIADWKPDITAMEHHLGIDPHNELYQRVHRMYLTVNPEQHPQM